MLLELAVKASLPLIAVETDDPLNIVKVLNATLGTGVEKFPTVTSPGGTSYDFAGIKQGKVYVMRKPAVDKLDWEKLYAKLAQKEAVTILVNIRKDLPEVFKAGFVGCPHSLICDFVESQLDTHEGPEFDALVSALSGLSYQSMVQITLLAQANSGNLSARSVREVRRVFFGNVQGLQQENTEVDYYSPSPDLTQWLDLEGQLFSDNAPKALRARGLLLDGPPGTGKTMGAKFIARALNVPLYRLDIGATMNKYVGESEKGLEAALAQALRCAPCVMLIDEVEKLFKGHSDSGVSTRALSQLLWWLQEHEARVLTIMTTNNKKALPPELIRPGRIDRAFTLDRLGSTEGLSFMQGLAAQYKKLAALTSPELVKLQSTLYAEPGSAHSHAVLTEKVMGMVKAKYLSANSKEN